MSFSFYPFAVPIIPSILKKIGFASFLTIVVNGISLVASGLDHNKELTDPYDSDWFWIMHSLISAPLKVILLTSAIEFVCAQLSCWYKMRDIATPYRWVEDAFEKYLASDNHII